MVRLDRWPAPRPRPPGPRHQLRRGDGRRLAARRRRRPRPGTSAASWSGPARLDALPGPDDPRRLLLRRRPRRRPDPGHPARPRLGDALRRFHDRGGLILGICNGFQVLVKAGLLPGGADAARRRSTHNDSGHFESRWVRLGADPGPLPVPRRRRADRAARRPRRGQVPHGRRRRPLTALEAAGQVVLRYVDEPGRPTQDYPANPNGSPGAVAGLCDPTGRIFGLMPHPERYVDPLHHPRWTRPARRPRATGCASSAAADGRPSRLESCESGIGPIPTRRGPTAPRLARPDSSSILNDRRADGSGIAPVARRSGSPLVRSPPVQLVRPNLFLRTPPHCLKKNGTPASRHWSRIERTHRFSHRPAPCAALPADDHPGDAAPGRSSPESSSSGSIERKRTAAGARRRWSIRGRPCRRFSTLTPHQMWGSRPTARSWSSRAGLASARALGQDLVDVPVRGLHHPRDRFDVIVRNVRPGTGRSSSS